MRPIVGNLYLHSLIAGGGLFVIGIIAATIMIISPFTVSKRALTRDIIIYMIACFWISRAFRNEDFSYLEANGKLSSLIELWLNGY